MLFSHKKQFSAIFICLILCISSLRLLLFYCLFDWMFLLNWTSVSIKQKNTYKQRAAIQRYCLIRAGGGKPTRGNVISFKRYRLTNVWNRKNERIVDKLIWKTHRHTISNVTYTTYEWMNEWDTRCTRYESNKILMRYEKIKPVVCAEWPWMWKRRRRRRWNDTEIERGQRKVIHTFSTESNVCLYNTICMLDVQCFK